MLASEKTPPTESQQKHASARMPSSPTARLKEADRTWRAKLCLRALAAILSLASASCFCTALAIWPQPAWDRQYSRRGRIALPTDALPLFPVRPPFPASTQHLPLPVPEPRAQRPQPYPWGDHSVYLLTRKRPLHPGIVIASDLAVWVTIGGLGARLVFGSVFWYYVGAHAAVRCVKSLNTDTYRNDARRTKGLCELAGLVLLAGVLVAHFALFVWLCREVDVRRKRERRRELEALYLQHDGKDEQGEMAGGVGTDVGGGPRSKTKRGERMAEEELSW